MTANETIDSATLANWLHRFSGLLHTQVEEIETTGLDDGNLAAAVEQEIAQINRVAERLGARDFAIKLPTQLDSGKLGM